MRFLYEVEVSAPDLNKKDRTIATRVLTALGVARTKRAMMNTCKKDYSNDGWDNCFFTQAFGNEDRLMALAQKHGVKSTDYYDEEVPVIDAVAFEEAIAKEIGVKKSDVKHVIGLFDDAHSVSYRGDSKPSGKVIAFLTFVMDWLHENGVTWNENKVTLQAHIDPEALAVA